jgi:hypothetical protein
MYSAKDDLKLSIEKSYKGNIGVFLVAAKLSQMNLIALTTSRNTKGYDIVVLDPSTNRGKGIQVKCTDKKEFPIMQSFLKDYKQEIQRKIPTDFVFVDISDYNKPRFFIVPMMEMRDLVKRHIETYIQKSKHRIPIEEMMKKETKKQGWVVKPNDIQKFEDNWKNFENL